MSVHRFFRCSSISSRILHHLSDSLTLKISYLPCLPNLTVTLFTYLLTSNPRPDPIQIPIQDLSKLRIKFLLLSFLVHPCPDFQARDKEWDKVNALNTWSRLAYLNIVKIYGKKKERKSIETHILSPCLELKSYEDWKLWMTMMKTMNILRILKIIKIMKIITVMKIMKLMTMMMHWWT